MIAERMLTLRECAERLHLSYCTVNKAAKTGRLKASKVGGWRVEPADLEKFIEENRPKVASAPAPKDEELPAVSVRRFA